jgi:hypothetical protein
MAYSACLGVVVGLVAAFPAFGDEKFTIRVKDRTAGETVRVEKEETRTTRTTVHDGLGRKLTDEQEKQVETFVYSETVLKVSADGEPTSLRRRYEKAQLKVGKTTNKHAFHGKTVLIRKEADGKFHFQYEGGGAVAPEDARPFDRDFNGADEKFSLASLLPGKPVRVGADWPVDMKLPVQDLSRTGRFAVDAAWATGSGHLEKTTPVGDTQFGQIVYRMEIPILAMTVSGPLRSPVTSGSKATFDLTLDMCIDGTLPDATFIGSGEVNATAALVQPGALPGKLTFAHKCDSREVRKSAEK